MVAISGYWVRAHAAHASSSACRAAHCIGLAPAASLLPCLLPRCCPCAASLLPVHCMCSAVDVEARRPESQGAAPPTRRLRIGPWTPSRWAGSRGRSAAVSSAGAQNGARCTPKHTSWQMRAAHVLHRATDPRPPTDWHTLAIAPPPAAGPHGAPQHNGPLRCDHHLLRAGHPDRMRLPLLRSLPGPGEAGLLPCTAAACSRAMHAHSWKLCWLLAIQTPTRPPVPAFTPASLLVTIKSHFSPLSACLCAVRCHRLHAPRLHHPSDPVQPGGQQLHLPPLAAAGAGGSASGVAPLVRPAAPGLC